MMHRCLDLYIGKVQRSCNKRLMDTCLERRRIDLSDFAKTVPFAYITREFRRSFKRVPRCCTIIDLRNPEFSVSLIEIQGDLEADRDSKLKVTRRWRNRD